MDELIGLTEEDHAALARLLAAFESGSLNRKPDRKLPTKYRVYEAIPFINASGQTIPAYGLVRVTTPTTVDGEMITNVAAVDATYRWRYLVNGPDDVDSASGSRGWGTWAFDRDKILYDTTATPVQGEHWGPKDATFKLFQHRPGFIVDGCYDATNGWLWAQQVIPGEVRVQNDDGGGALAGGSGGRTFGIYGGAAGTTDTGLEVTLTNSSSVSWAATKYGFATADAGGLIFGAPQQT